MIKSTDFFLLLPEIPTRDHFTFRGWSREQLSSSINYDPQDIYSPREYVSFDENTTLYAVWEKTVVEFEFIKTDETIYNLDLPIEEVVRLNGAIFTIERYIATINSDEEGRWRLVGENTSGIEETETGLVQFVLQYGSTYRLRETVSPEGFQLPEGYWIIEVDEEGVIGAPQAHGTWVLAFRYHEGNLFLGNMAKIELPESGGVGTKGERGNEKRQ